MRPFRIVPIDFDGTVNARIVCGLGNINVNGPSTLVAAIEMPALTGLFGNLIQVETAGGASLLALLHDASSPQQVYYENEHGGSSPASGIPLAAGVRFVVASGKATGSVVARHNVFSRATGAMTRQNGSTARADPASAEGRVALGVWNAGSHFFQGYGTAWAIYNRALSDAETDCLAVDLGEWMELGPAAMWVANGTTPLVDLTGGGADETSRGSGLAAAAAAVLPVLSWPDAMRPEGRSIREPLRA